ncbi:DUF5598 domain-containing protein [Candidatus Woesearchaeota archaeon]|nr:DUF5598 domain-containing protein [Candidatus Woesearchaeota archaeon]
MISGDEMLPLAETKDQIEFWNKFQPVNRAAATDTYKRTMSGSSELFADSFACYNLAARKGIREEGANNRLIMAGLEKALYSFFMNPVTKKEVDSAREFFTKKGMVKKFPEKAWQAVLDNGGYFPIDIYGLPGGQTFLVKDGKHVPVMSVEGTGALVSHLEPHLENLYTAIIQATKARLFYEVVRDRFAEFGLRSDQNLNNHVLLMASLYVGAGFKKTSDDQARFLFPEYFEDIGTVGHEFPMAYQKEGRTLEEAQDLAYDDFVRANERSALLPDVVHTIKSGLPTIMKLVKKYQGTNKTIIPRFDSGNVPGQCVTWKKETLEEEIEKTGMVVEDGYNPTKARETFKEYNEAGFNEEEIITGAGGYFQEGCERDTISLAYKRSATMHGEKVIAFNPAGMNGIDAWIEEAINSGQKIEASLKFSDSLGKESIPGRVRVYENGSTLIVAQEGEQIDGTPVYQKLLSNGRIVYDEDLHKQNSRANNTWNKYNKIEYSPKTLEIIDTRRKEKEELLNSLEGN